MKQLLMILIGTLILSMLATACRHSAQTPLNQTAALAGQPSPTEVTVKTFQIEQQGWGYDIFLGEKLYIHQPHIPAVNGNRGFASRETAQKVGELVAQKIRQNNLPPTVSIAELESLAALPTNTQR